MRLSHVILSANKLAHKCRTFSGIQPTGTLHLGNYFGAVQQWVTDVESNTNQRRDEQLFSIVDLHALTMPQNPELLRDNIFTMTASLFGCGLNPEKAIVFQQSHVLEHTQLCWLLGCLGTVSTLTRLSQYKEKSRTLKEVPLGLLTYPVLQAADILLYRATRVPVGEDNLQNLETCRQLASKFNSTYKVDLFPQPETVLVKDEASRRIRSLKDPTKKMSKSDINQKSCLYILDDPDTIRLKIRRALTDFTSEVTYDPDNRPGVSNLLCIHSRITGQDAQTICEEVRGKDTGEYKLLLAEVVIEHFKPIRERTNYLLENKDHLQAVLEKGSQSAREIAQVTLQKAYEAVGIK